MWCPHLLAGSDSHPGSCGSSVPGPDAALSTGLTPRRFSKETAVPRPQALPWTPHGTGPLDTEGPLATLARPPTLHPSDWRC